MKSFVAATLAGLSILGGIGSLALVASEADARPLHHHHRGARVGVYIGAPIIAAPFYHHHRPYYRSYGSYGPYAYPYYAPAYYPPVVVQEQPLVYVEQPAAAAQVQQAPPPTSAPQAQAQQQFWYFCQDSQTYYPHAQTCTSPWQRVTPHAAQ